MKKQPEDDFIDILTQSYTHIDGVENTAEHCELDIGCGAGSFTAGLAKRYPEAKIFAADVMIGRLRKLVRKNQRLRKNTGRVYLLCVSRAAHPSDRHYRLE